MKKTFANLLFRFVDGACFRALRYHCLDLLFSYRVTRGAFDFENGKKKIADEIQKPHNGVSDLCEYTHGSGNDLCNFFSLQQSDSLWDQFTENDGEKGDDDNDQRSRNR